MPGPRDASGRAGCPTCSTMALSLVFEQPDDLPIVERTAEWVLNGKASAPALLSRKRHGLWTPVDLSSGHIPSNLPLGVRDSADFSQVAVSVEAGDRVAIYTDGITECTNASGEEFGQERLCALLEDCCCMDLNATKRCLLEALRRHAGQAPYEDDLTLLLIEITSNNVPNPARGRGGRTAAAGSARAN